MCLPFNAREAEDEGGRKFRGKRGVGLHLHCFITGEFVLVEVLLALEY